MKYKISQYAKKNHVTYRTVWNWIKSGKVLAEQNEKGSWFIIEEEPTTLKVAVYARVSSSENKTNLETQKQRLLDFCSARGYIVEAVVTEIGSGLNDERPKLEKLLLDQSINLIVVEHKDRLARFGVNYIEKLLGLSNRKILYLNTTNSDEEDIVQDFVSIITSFCARIYGKRRSKRSTERIIKNLKENK